MADLGFRSSGKTLAAAWAAGLGAGASASRCSTAISDVSGSSSLLDQARRASGTAGGAETPAGTPDFDGQAMVDRVFAELAGHQGRTFLVIDDLHELRSPEALTQLTRLLTSLPPDLHAILATRRDLPLRLHQLRLAGELAELRAADLRFSLGEARELLAVSGVTLSEAGVRLLHEQEPRGGPRACGWRRSRWLVTLAQNHFVKDCSGSSRAVFVLITEMFEGQPANVARCCCTPGARPGQPAGSLIC